MIDGKTPLELVFGRTPPPLFDLETANPEQITNDPLVPDQLTEHMKVLAIKANLEAKQSDDLRRDMAARIKPSEGPYKLGDKVFYWAKDHSKIKEAGVWQQ